ncbi:MAG: DNA translocase FtsK [Pseudomonadota bacterium]
MAKSSAAKKERKTERPARPALRVVSDDSMTHNRVRELAGVGLLAASVLMGLALFSYQPAGPGWPDPHGPANLVGPAGAVLADLLFASVGVGAYLLAGGLLLAGAQCFRPRRLSLAWSQALGIVIALVGATTIAHIALTQVADIAYPPGGLLGAVVGDAGVGLLAPVGTGILAGAVLAVGALLATNLSLSTLVEAVVDAARHLAEWCVDLVAVQRERWRLRGEKRAERLALAASMAEAAQQAELEEQAQREERKLKRREAVRVRAENLAESDVEREARRVREAQEAATLLALAPSYEEAAVTDPGSPALDEIPSGPDATYEPAGSESEGRLFSRRQPVDAPSPLAQSPLEDPPWVTELLAVEPDAANEDGEIASDDDELHPVEHETSATAPRIVEFKPRSKRDQKKLVEATKDERPQPIGDRFELPPLNLLDYDAPDEVPVDIEALNEQARKLVKKFRDYGIEGAVREIRPGPVVTTYEFVPAAGTRIAKISSLADDLAMAMEAIRVRVVAPIPGKGAVGIEIPNENRQSVFLKEIIASKEFQRSTSKLAMAVGKDIEGRPVHLDLAKMPHMLIAGTTGSGKSVAINTIITSILYKATPDDVRFLMIDPKMLELSIYEGIPHLLLPPVTDPKKAAAALCWAVNEMERRYQLLADAGVRDIMSYNKKVDRLSLAAPQDATPASPEPTAAGTRKKVIIHDERESGETAEPVPDTAAPAAEAPLPTERLPYIVVVVDEFADLMMVAPRDVETYIARLAQKARACGIHVLLATQRPSTDVITGVIKANFPVRMSFQVASNHDSKTIINGVGAEKLLGKGDMLLIPPGASGLMRCHGAFISEVEINRLVEFLKTQGTPSYDETILQAGVESSEGEGHSVDEEYDEHYDAAVAIVAESRQVSISMIQRRLKIGYNRSARIVERMEKDGLIGPQYPGNKQREVFVQPIVP